jgi:uncharacterized protein
MKISFTNTPTVWTACMIVLLIPAMSAATRYKVQPKLTKPAELAMKLGGVVGDRLRANLENWELRAPEANPALLEMFFDRDRKPDRKLLPWSGEFVGKYLCSSILSYRLLRDPRQKELIERVTARFLASQDVDGYLGPFDRKSRLTGENWDIWGHYWAIRALLLYHEEFSSPPALNAATKAADMLVEKFLNKDFHFTNDKSYGEMNYAVIHAFTQLYKLTGKPSYLEMAEWIVREWDLPGAGLYMRLALAGKEMYEFAGNRWESLHDFQGMYEMYLITGEQKYHDAFKHIWHSIQKGDRHNTGGFTSGERTTGNPYHRGAIETCCTVAWIDMSIDMLRLSANPVVADELELATYNGLIGGQHPSGRWWTYNTPMDGTKEASAHTINFQCRPGSPELNCCSVNAPRGLALLSEWAILGNKDGVMVNFYGPMDANMISPSGRKLTLRQTTNYPVEGIVALDLTLAAPEKFSLGLRIPSWSQRTRARVNGQPVEVSSPGSYLQISREWRSGDRVELELDMSPHFWVGDREAFGKTSIYYGPLLLAFDPVYNSMDPDQIPELNASGLKLEPVTTDRVIRPWLLLKTISTPGTEVLLSDFATAGAYGNRYVSWLPVKNVAAIPYDPKQPIWSNRSIAGGPTE